MSNGDPQQVAIEETVRQIHVVCEQMVQMNELVREVLTKMPQGQHVTMTHKTEGLGTFSVVCAAFAFCCLLGVAGLGWMMSVELNKQSQMMGIELNKQTADLHDLRAWRDIHAQRIGALEAQRKEK